MLRPTKHPKTRVYRSRSRVPKALQDIIGSAERVVSLATKDPQEAKRKAPAGRDRRRSRFSLDDNAEITALRQAGGDIAATIPEQAEAGAGGVGLAGAIARASRYHARRQTECDATPRQPQLTPPAKLKMQPGGTVGDLADRNKAAWGVIRREAANSASPILRSMPNAAEQILVRNFGRKAQLAAT